MSVPFSKPTRISREDLRKDIAHLVPLNTQMLATLLNPSTLTSQTDLATPFPAQPAIHLLNTYTPSTTDHDSSQSLIKAYIRDMREEILPMGAQEGVGESEGDKLGARIDLVRAKAEGVSEALEGVKL